ncbi:L-2-amino-thiazoline-4-carboxylic acid hydrolase [Cetobacterium sp. 2A]|uniref:L-2-amino-thiazoline-4-carboxylic acid hydrolase n=1 Tax=unclassified Cetobacterium TaxID=2630983 RepID=UPI00163C96D3|nr:L-2-amino-thiazoline-4-carboxylic acid hydrolase [Cetobacterium sp. 2A]MBC2857184.1 L-2-amino-thiazoline-4-carboxylic acid hydrolase [Cetobacterium sp. 2A]
MSKLDNKPNILNDEKSNIQRGAIGHRATWMALTYLEAKNAKKENDGEEFARKAIAKTGFKDGETLKKLCGEGEINCSEFADIFLTPILRNTFEVEFKNKTEDRLDVEFHHCPLLKAWQDLGIDDDTCAKLCDIAMEGDRNIAKGMGLEFHLGNTIAEGHPTCQISFFKK